MSIEGLKIARNDTLKRFPHLAAPKTGHKNFDGNYVMCKKNLANRFAFALLATALLLPVAGYAASERARQALEDNPALQHAPDSVLVRFAAGTNGNERAEAMRAAHASHARTLMASARLEQLYLIAGRPVEAALNALSRLPFVESAEADFVVRAVTNDQFYGLLYAINNTGQVVASQSGTFDADMDVAEAWSLSIGDPDLVIAVIDDGVEYTHPDINDQMWVNPGEVVDDVDNDGNGYVDDIFGYDFYSNDSDPYDDNNINTEQGGHGTHVAGTICAEGNNSIGIVGVVQQCRIMALRFLGPQGVGYTSDAISAVNYAVGKGVRLSNNSWGGGDYSMSLYLAIQSAGNQGHLFLAAAGNDGIDVDNTTPHYPSSYDLPNIVSVAATDNRDQLASFSNFGVNSVDVAAPGVDIASSAWGSYYFFSGTSMATPNVTGVAALILSQNPGFSYAQVRDRLLQTARPVPGLSGKVATGGVVNALAALSVTPPEPPPAAPSNLAAQATGTNSIALTFTDNASDEDGFKVYRSAAGADFSLLTTLSADTTAHTDEGLSAGTSYTYEVTAFNTAGESAASNTATATTDTEPVTLPSAPSALSAQATSFDTVVLNFTDNADNEDGFEISRSVAGAAFSVLTTLDADVTSFADSGLEAETAYAYRVLAFNAAGDSATSNQATATTPAAPSSEQVVALSDQPVAGTVSGSVVATYANDGVTQSITEIESGGRPNRRHSYLEHRWVFSLPPSTGATVHANAWSNAAESSEGFEFSYSLNGSSYVSMFTLAGGNENSASTYLLPPGAAGTLTIRVTDTDQTPGASVLDTVYIDHLYVEAAFEQVDPPVAPGTPVVLSSVPGAIQIGWADNATDESGYEVERADAGGQFAVIANLGADSTEFLDDTVASATAYRYRVRAVNVGGYSDYSGELAVTSETIVMPDIVLQASGYKIKSFQNVDLSWSGATGNVNVTRNGQTIASGVSGGSYSDNNISKGGAVYDYQVCPAAGGDCSNIVTVVF